jgi:hypothetical protein
MLDSNSQLAIPGESHFIPGLIAKRQLYEGGIAFNVERFVADLSEHVRFVRWDIPTEDLVASFSDERPAGLADAVRRLYQAYADRQRKLRFGDKTPDYVVHIPALADLFPDAVFVHIVRDGRDVALSLIDVEWGVATVTDAAEMWLSYVEAGRTSGRLLGSDRYREIRYEDLVAEPERELRRLCTFLRLDFEANMLAYYHRAEEIRRSVLSPTSHGRLALPPTPQLRDWRHEMASSDVSTFAAIAEDTLQELGYEA